MKLITVARWDSSTRVHFTFRTDTVLVAPSVTIDWRFKGDAFTSTLKGLELDGKSVSGYVDAIVDGDFVITGTMDAITIRDGGQSYTSEKPEDPVRDVAIELISVSYKEPFAVNRQYYMPSLDGYGGLYSFINRLSDNGNSGVNLRKTVAKGWSLPGVLTPGVADEVKLAEILAEPFEDSSNALNRCYIVGSDLVFARGSSSGNIAYRTPLTTVYSLSVLDSIVVNDPVRSVLQQAFSGKMETVPGYEWYSSTEIEAPEVGEFYDEISLIFANEYPVLDSDPAASLRAFVPPRTQDRNQQDVYSIRRRIHNEIKEY